MSTSIANSACPTIQISVHYTKGERGRRKLKRGKQAKPEPITPGNIPRITRLLALAHKMEDLVQQGHVTSYADMARIGGVTRARVSQILGLLLLAPDIQEHILFLPRTTTGRDPVSERQLRPIVAEADWDRQREMYEPGEAQRSESETP